MMKKFLLAISFFFYAAIYAAAQEISKKELERNIDAGKIYKEEEPGKKEKIYKEWLKKYPPQKFPSSIMMYEYVKGEISKSFAAKGNVAKALEYANMLKPGDWRAEGLAQTATLLASKGKLDEAEYLFKKAGGEANNVKNKSVYSLELSKILSQKKNLAEALIYARQAWELNPDDSLITLNYADVLDAGNDAGKAFNVLEEIILKGKSNRRIRARHKEIYFKIKGESSWEDYIKKLNSRVHELKAEELKSQMTAIPAPPFTLYDLDGNYVSLSDYKGKTVVLDFWATWCIPCRQSFPAMQMAVDKYADDPGVHFLFIHTWERENHAIMAARDFLKKYHYRFHVLMDLKDPVTEVNNTVENYKLSSIPAKLVVDKNGIIRFIVKGFSNNEEEDVVEEISIMIELASQAAD